MKLGGASADGAGCRPTGELPSVPEPPVPKTSKIEPELGAVPDGSPDPKLEAAPVVPASTYGFGPLGAGGVGGAPPPPRAEDVPVLVGADVPAAAAVDPEPGSVAWPRLACAQQHPATNTAIRRQRKLMDATELQTPAVSCLGKWRLRVPGSSPPRNLYVGIESKNRYLERATGIEPA